MKFGSPLLSSLKNKGASFSPLGTVLFSLGENGCHLGLAVGARRALGGRESCYQEPSDSSTSVALSFSFCGVQVMVLLGHQCKQGLGVRFRYSSPKPLPEG